MSHLGLHYAGSLIALPSTVEAIAKAVNEVAKFDAGMSQTVALGRLGDFAYPLPCADEWFVIAITDANFGRYDITAEDLKRAMNRQPKVKTALICIGEGAEATWYGCTCLHFL